MSEKGQVGGLTRRELGRMLGYGQPGRAVAELHRKYCGHFIEGVHYEMRTMVSGNGSGTYVTYFYFVRGILGICSYSEQPDRESVVEWAYNTLR